MEKNLNRWIGKQLGKTYQFLGLTETGSTLPSPYLPLDG